MYPKVILYLLMPKGDMILVSVEENTQKSPNLYFLELGAIDSVQSNYGVEKRELEKGRKHAKI